VDIYSRSQEAKDGRIGLVHKQIRIHPHPNSIPNTVEVAHELKIALGLIEAGKVLGKGSRPFSLGAHVALLSRTHQADPIAQVSRKVQVRVTLDKMNFVLQAMLG
jgi:hypothetical protein